ncbi:MAG: acetate/propionate family kinase [Planctomycetota bacterium]
MLVINAGSSSLKFAVVNSLDGSRLLGGLIEGIGGGEGARLSWSAADGGDGSRDLGTCEQADAFAVLAELLVAPGAPSIDGIGHRVVHGGEAFTGSVVIDDAMIAQVEACVPLAPLHNPANLAGIAGCRKLFPDLTQVAVFDTAFHQTMPEHAYRYAVPEAWYREHGVRKYGFHGTSHRFVAERAAELLGKEPAAVNLITAHLGNGCSLCAVAGGKSVDTTMGMTPLAGVAMGTRSGDIDPGLHAYLCDALGCDIDAVTAALNKQSGLLGLSGLSNDLRTLRQAASDGHEGAELALAVFCYRVAQSIATMAIALGRVDAVVFTGGIGENAKPVRARIVELLAPLAITLDADRNDDHGRASGAVISADGSGPRALVVPTDEELLIARDSAALIVS